MLKQHTIEEDFDHFLAYSGLAAESNETKAKLFLAYEANWKPSPEVDAANTFGCNSVDELHVCHECGGSGLRG